jgi:hypothetical protein
MVRLLREVFMSETNEIVPAEKAVQGADVLTGAWSVDRHLSPLALFDPNRTSICAQFQLALIDDVDNDTRAHNQAARRHLEAALKGRGITASNEPRYLKEWLRGTCVQLDKFARGWE